MAFLDELRAAQAKGLVGGSYINNGVGYAPKYGDGHYNGSPEVGDWVSGDPTEYLRYAMGNPKGGVTQYANAPYERFSADGQSLGTGNFDSKIGKMDTMGKLALLAVMAGGGAVVGGALAPGLMGGGGALGAGGEAAAGGVAGDAFLPGALSAEAGSTGVIGDAFLPGALSGNAGSTGVLGDAFLPGALAGDAGSSGVAGDMFMPGSLAPGGGMGSTGNTLATTAAKGAGSSVLDALGGAKSLGGLATLAGGLLGSQGTEQSQTTSRGMNPVVEPYVKSLLSQTSGLLDQQMSPEFQNQFAQQRQLGQGLMSIPQVGNGYGKFYGK